MLIILVPRPKPLSSVVKHQLNARVVSQSAVINATLEKIAEARYLLFFFLQIHSPLAYSNGHINLSEMVI